MGDLQGPNEIKVNQPEEKNRLGGGEQLNKIPRENS